VNLQDDSFAACCTHLYKFDYDYNIVWISEYGGGGGDKCLRQLINGYFIFSGISAQWTIKLVKTNENGEVPIDDYKIISFVTDLSFYPNPFSILVNISLSCGTRIHEQTEIEIYNIKGQLVRELELIPKSVGTYEAMWDGRDRNDDVISNGIYFLKLESNEFKYVKKITKIGE
jgi:hypothetical protein